MNAENVKKTNLMAMLATIYLGTSSVAHALDFQVGDTDVSVYGYVQLDAVYNDGPDMDASGFMPMQVQPDGVPGSDGHFDMGAYTSRIGVSSTTPTSQGPLKIVLEGDFHDGGGPGFRLRHAYGSWNGLLAGQTWTELFWRYRLNTDC